MTYQRPDLTWIPAILPPGLLLAKIALDRIGAARFGNEWTGDEWVARRLDHLSVDPAIRALQLAKAAEWDVPAEPGRRVRVAASVVEYEAHARAYARWAEVYWPIARWLADNPTFAKLMDHDGRLWEVPRNIWRARNSEEFTRQDLAIIEYDQPRRERHEGVLLIATAMVAIFSDPAIRPPSPRWSLLQALTWVCTRDRALVGRAAPGPGKNLVWLQNAIDAGLPGQTTAIRDGVRIEMRGQGAGELIMKSEDELLNRLRGDTLGSVGLKNAEGDPISMSAEAYQASSLMHDDSDGLCIVPDDPSRPGASIWTRVTLSTAKVMDTWPEPVAMPETRDATSIKPLTDHLDGPPLASRASTSDINLQATESGPGSVRAGSRKPSETDPGLVNAGSTKPADQILRSGAPGRPSSMHLIEDEFNSRAAAGQLEPTLAGMAISMHQWLIDNHPVVRRPTQKTIENNLRHKYRAAKSAAAGRPQN